MLLCNEMKPDCIYIIQAIHICVCNFLEQIDMTGLKTILSFNFKLIYENVRSTILFAGYDIIPVIMQQ